MKQYSTCSSNAAIDDIFEDVNRQQFINYSSISDSYYSSRITVNTLFSYKDLISRLSNDKRIEFITFNDFVQNSEEKSKIQVLIRHDVDGDIVGAYQQAKVESELGVSTSYYFLHSAPYYGKMINGVFHRGVFRRNECMGHIYYEIQEMGHEVGIHSDPLFFYKEYGVDGAMALKTELEWLRSLKININGTLAHNSASYYGAENYEIFKGRYRPSLKKINEKPSEIINVGNAIVKLRQLDEKELGLKYEPHLDVPGSVCKMYEYGATRLQNLWRWVKYSKNNEAHIRKGEALPFIDQDSLVQDILSLPEGTIIQLVVHPCYYGLRYSGDYSPPLFRNDFTTCVNPMLGWETYQPERIHCFSDFSTYQSISQANTLGMLDLPWPDDAKTENETRILVLGSGFIDAKKVSVMSQSVAMIERTLNENYKNTDYIVRKLAFPGMGLTRLWSWYERVQKDFQADVLVLTINPWSLLENVPEFWSMTTGFSIIRPSGDYLISNKGVFQSVPANQNWKLYQSKSNPKPEIKLNKKNGLHIFADRRDMIDGEPGDKWLKSLYLHIVKILKEDSIQPLLLSVNDKDDNPFKEYSIDVAEFCDVPLIFADLSGPCDSRFILETSIIEKLAETISNWSKNEL